MKKLIFIIFLSTFIFLTGCSNSKFKSISLDKLYDKINDKESFIVYFEEESNTLKSKLETVLKNNNLDGFVINASKISSEEKLKLEPAITYEGSTIVFIINGKDPSRLSHVTNSETTIKEIEARLIDMNFIKSNEE